ncbi:hypothetical protein BpHYR1_048240, partial [Brachionus plicatilis]
QCDHCIFKTYYANVFYRLKFLETCLLNDLLILNFLLIPTQPHLQFFSHDEDIFSKNFRLKLEFNGYDYLSSTLTKKVEKISQFYFLINNSENLKSAFFFGSFITFVKCFVYRTEQTFDHIITI